MQLKVLIALVFATLAAAAPAPAEVIAHSDGVDSYRPPPYHSLPYHPPYHARDVDTENHRYHHYYARDDNVDDNRYNRGYGDHGFDDNYGYDDNFGFDDNLGFDDHLGFDNHHGYA